MLGHIMILIAVLAISWFLGLNPLDVDSKRFEGS
jgi:hypothetical protein